jgi:tyrosinase
MNLTESSMTALTAPSDGKVEEVYALIGDIALGDNVRGIRVFVNHPELSIETPDTDPHYVKTIAFLDHSRHGDDNANKQLPSVLVNLTATLKRLRGFDRLKVGEISVQLIPIPVDGVIIDNVGQVVPDTLEIVVL